MFMKSIKFLLVAFLLGMATTASAQFANAGAASASKTTTEVTPWSGLRFSYNPITVNMDYEDADDINLTGLSLGFVKGIAVTKNIPLFIETGVNVTYAFKTETESDSDEDYDYEYEVRSTISMLSATIPVNFGYKYAFNEKLSIFPFVGLTARVNILGQQKVKATLEYDGDEETEEEKVNLFDKDDMGGSKYTWKRFQIGWQIGATLNINKFAITASYGSDFNEIAKKTKVAVPAISVGVNF